MKVILIFLIMVTLQLRGQDTLSAIEDSLPTSNPHPYEVGYTIIGIKSNQSLLFVDEGAPIFEALNGILIRYKYRKFSLRFHACYFYKKTEREYDPSYFTRNFGEATIKDYKLGAGLQYTFCKKQDYIYVLLDLSYRKRVATAAIHNAQPQSHTNLISKLNGMDIITGIGSKIKIVKNFNISIEAGYDYTYAVGKTTYRDYQFILQESKNETLSYNNLFTKLYLSLNF